ncbi:MAG: pilus assembly protein [Alphaproteobacteria bacterium]|nr:pilus assembly protein [Alphaproteobacteria bacterium]
MRARILRNGTIARLLRLGQSDRGAAAVEFALVTTILVPLLLNMIDFSILIWSKMAVENAAQMGAQAAFHTCASGPLPATTNCANFSSAITTAIHSTSLGSNVSQASGSPNENYGCTSGTTIVSVGSYSSPPSPYDCSTVGNSGITPGDYVTVGVTYSYTPLFSGISLVSSQTLASSGIQRLQ